MSRARRFLSFGLGLPLALFAVLFVVLWIAGPTPVRMGPYVQNVTTSSADICSFDAAACRVRVELRPVDGAAQVLIDPAPVRAHRARFTGLEPDTRYQYTITPVDGTGASFVGRFKTAPGDRTRAFQFAVVGDSGDLPNWFKLQKFGFGRIRPALRHLERTAQWDVAEWMVAQRPDFFFHLGDIIYSHNQLPAYQEGFFLPFAGVLQNCAFFNTFGNHDLHRWKHPEFFSVFHTPKPLDPAQEYRDYSYSYDWGGVRFVVLDAIWQPWAEGSAMRNWLIATLRDNPLPRTIVFIHHPPFTDELKAVNATSPVHDKLWPLLVEHKVQMVISGDTHSYQRFKPVDGVTVVIAGTGGKSIRPVAPTGRLAHHEEQFGFLLIKVAGSRIEGEFWTGAAKPADAFVVVQ